MRIASFNLQNLRLRGGSRLDGARDSDTGETADPALDRMDRKLTAQVIGDMKADVLALQEVFDRATLDHFHDNFLLPAGVRAYPWRHCSHGNDGRGLDIALLSRIAPLEVTGHAGLRAADIDLRGDPEKPVFRRDCLRVEFAGVTLFLCHFKAPYPDPASAWAARRLEARAVRRLVERRFTDPASATWLIAGDLNEPWEPDGNPASAPLLAPFAVDLMARIKEQDRWSFYDRWSDRYAMPDAFLASPALARAFPRAMPEIHREGLERAARRHAGVHLPSVGRNRPHASDHAGVVVEFAGL